MKKQTVVPKWKPTADALHGDRPFEVFKISIADVDFKRPQLWHGSMFGQVKAVLEQGGFQASGKPGFEKLHEFQHSLLCIPKLVDQQRNTQSYVACGI